MVFLGWGSQVQGVLGVPACEVSGTRYTKGDAVWSCLEVTHGLGGDTEVLHSVFAPSLDVMSSLVPRGLSNITRTAADVGRDVYVTLEVAGRKSAPRRVAGVLDDGTLAYRELLIALVHVEFGVVADVTWAPTSCASCGGDARCDRGCGRDLTCFVCSQPEAQGNCTTGGLYNFYRGAVNGTQTWVFEEGCGREDCGCMTEFGGCDASELGCLMNIYVAFTGQDDSFNAMATGPELLAIQKNSLSEIYYNSAKYASEKRNDAGLRKLLGSAPTVASRP